MQIGSTSVPENTLILHPAGSLLPSRVTGPIWVWLTVNNFVVRYLCFGDGQSMGVVPLVYVCAFPERLYFHFRW